MISTKYVSTIETQSLMPKVILGNNQRLFCGNQANTREADSQNPNTCEFHFFHYPKKVLSSLVYFHFVIISNIKKKEMLFSYSIE